MPAITVSIPSAFLARVALFAGIMAPAIPACAASDAVCRDYAQRAVAQNAENDRMRCGFRGPRWHGGEAGHFIFCKAATDDFVHAELSTREGKLRECQATANAGAPHGGANNNQAGDPGRSQQEESVVVDIDEGNQGPPLIDTPGEGVFIDTAVECKARRVAVSAEHQSPSEAERLSLSGWEEIVGSSYGGGFSDVGKAKDADLTCSADGGQTQCTFSGFPCNG